MQLVQMCIHLGAKMGVAGRVGGVEGGCINVQWPQAAAEETPQQKVSKPRALVEWEGTAPNGEDLAIKHRMDHFPMLLLTQSGKYLLSQRIDVCGATAY